MTKTKNQNPYTYWSFNIRNFKMHAPFLVDLLQSRPIEMRATILYLANRWTEFEMLLTPLRFLYLVMFSLLAFPSIPQFIAHFWQISSFLCIVLPFSNSYRNESCSKACSAHFAPAAILFFLPFCEWTKWRTKEGLKSSNQGYRGGLEL